MSTTPTSDILNKYAMSIVAAMAGRWVQAGPEADLADKKADCSVQVVFRLLEELAQELRKPPEVGTYLVVRNPSVPVPQVYLFSELTSARKKAEEVSQWDNDANVGIYRAVQKISSTVVTTVEDL